MFPQQPRFLFNISSHFNSFFLPFHVSTKCRFHSNFCSIIFFQPILSHNPTGWSPPCLGDNRKGRLRVGARHIRAPEVVLGLDLQGPSDEKIIGSSFNWLFLIGFFGITFTVFYLFLWCLLVKKLSQLVSSRLKQNDLYGAFNWLKKYESNVNMVFP